jgi:hypothetical protein
LSSASIDVKSEVLFVKNLYIQALGLTLDFWGRIEHFLLMNTVNPVQSYPRYPGLNLDPGSTNSSRIATQGSQIQQIGYILKDPDPT